MYQNHHLTRRSIDPVLDIATAQLTVRKRKRPAQIVDSDSEEEEIPVVRRTRRKRGGIENGPEAETRRLIETFANEDAVVDSEEEEIPVVRRTRRKIGGIGDENAEVAVPRQLIEIENVASRDEEVVANDVEMQQGDEPLANQRLTRLYRILMGREILIEGVRHGQSVDRGQGDDLRMAAFREMEVEVARLQQFEKDKKAEEELGGEDDGIDRINGIIRNLHRDVVEFLG
jgi:hypothetical protein